MKTMRKFLLGLVALGCVPMLSAQESLLLINESNLGLRDGKISVIDVNNEGKYDVIFAGRSDKGATDQVYIFRSNGDGTFTAVDNTMPIPGGKWISATWEDLNNDGKIDLFTSGTFGDAGGNYVKVLTNNGDGTFTDDWELDLPQYAPGSAAADFDNDGIVDFIIYGNQTPGQLMFRKADGSIDQTINILPQGVTLFGDVNVTLVDINNDGFLDFFVCGYVHDADAKRRYSGLFLNNGDRTFTETNILEKLKSSNQATALFADLDQDGLMDMVFFGHEGSGSMYVYLNVGDGDLVEAKKVDGIYQTKTVPNSGVLADINNDGLYDLVANVYNGTNNNPRERLFFFTGTGENVDFLELNSDMSANFMGGSNGSVAVLDVDGNGVLDFAVMGYNYNLNGNDAFCAIYKNTTYTATNQAPTAPTGLSSSVADKGVTLSWGEATDDKTPAASLSYNLYLKNKTNGKYYRTPKADLATGRRLVFDHGNMFLAKNISFNNLPDGVYEWSVQAIDAAYAGGNFASMATFIIGDDLGLSTDALDGIAITITKNREITLTGAQAVKMSLYSLTGTLLQEVTNQNSISEKNAGVYIVKAETANGTVTKKVVL